MLLDAKEMMEPFKCLEILALKGENIMLSKLKHTRLCFLRNVT